MLDNSTFSTLFVKSTNSGIDNCSGRRVRRSEKLELSVESWASERICFSDTRSILRRWLNTVFTTRRKSCSSQPRSVTSLRVIRITALCTLGGGLNTPGSTWKRYYTWYQALISTERMPYCLLPGWEAMRRATSCWIIPVQQGMRSLLSSILKKICEEIS